MTLEQLFENHILVFRNFVNSDHTDKIFEKILLLVDLDSSLPKPIKEEIVDNIDSISSVIKNENHVGYIKFKVDYDITYFGIHNKLSVYEIRNFETALKFSFDDGFTEIKEEDILPPPTNALNTIDSFLKESKDVMPLNITDWNRKVIFFDDNATREDVETIYDYLVSLGADKWGLSSEEFDEECIEECLQFLETYNHLYFKIAKNTEGGYWVNYGWDIDDYYNLSFDNVFDYQDVLEFIKLKKSGSVYDFLSQLHESDKSNKKLKVNDKLLCYNDVVMSDDGEICFFKGKSYTVVKLSNYGHITLINDCGGDEHEFSLYPEDHHFYGEWFVLLKDYENKISNIFDTY